jgi:serine phosphatase RsbU (regulator of sigma subunit)
VSGKEVDKTKDIHLAYGRYSLRFDFVGLNFSSPNSVKYQYKIEGWEDKWSDLSSKNSAYYPRVEDGKYTFLLRTYNAEGLYNKDPLKVKISINAPFWKTWWFNVLSFVFVILVFFSIIFIRERRQIVFQKYLQKLLDERTAEVVRQKGEIELKNRDITDSINYAKRIQSSIMPSVDRLNNYFPESFIYYLPRDIVSGDFYWFDQLENGKVILVCADSTGHGVPGAFMSMIGVTLIKDICSRTFGLTPSSALTKLDNNLMNILSENNDADPSFDGMDVIFCEFDVEKKILKFASAMLPVIIMQNGHLIYIEGSKHTISGCNPCIDKVFTQHEIQLNQGDIIYMFTDGYSDQFGGEKEKKFKISQIKTMLNRIYHLPLKEQLTVVEKSFNDWKTSYDQVDDVLFIGIKI